MKIPLSPPDFKKLLKNMPDLALNEKLIKPTTENGEYIHWDKLRHLPTPEGTSSEQWWACIKLARRIISKELTFEDKNHKKFVYVLTDTVINQLHKIDRKAGFYTKKINKEVRDDYLVRSLIEEAINSSQLEGASTTRKIAKEMLRSSRKPRDVSEQMIFNNFKAMQFIREMKENKLTLKIICELHRILISGTMENTQDLGHIRQSNDIHVWDNTEQILHTPPNYEELESRLEKLCNFANTNDEQGGFIHPVIKAIILHFMLAYDHPFADGNGRTARALFYWSLAHEGYTLMEFISISQVIKLAPTKYAKAYLYTETDGNDLTYYFLHQLEVILEGIRCIEEYIDRTNEDIKEIEQLLYENKILKNKMNHRQITVIKHAMKHPNTQYKIEVHRQSHNITYDTARTDLLKLDELGLLIKTKTGKSFTFIAPPNLKEIMNDIE
jgi:Fic family protein